MINYIRIDDEDKAVAVTTGCGCCSTEISVEVDRDEVISELKLNLKVLEDTCKVLGITIDELKSL